MLKVHQIIGITYNGDMFNEDIHFIIVVQHLYAANPDTQCEKNDETFVMGRSEMICRPILYYL